MNEATMEAMQDVIDERARELVSEDPDYVHVDDILEYVFKDEDLVQAFIEEYNRRKLLEQKWRFV
jgi:hypothetical protein